MPKFFSMYQVEWLRSIFGFTWQAPNGDQWDSVSYTVDVGTMKEKSPEEILIDVSKCYNEMLKKMKEYNNNVKPGKSIADVIDADLYKTLGSGPYWDPSTSKWS